MKEQDVKVQRHSWYMEKQCGNDLPEVVFPPGFFIKNLVRGKEEQLWCDLTNGCFASGLGQEGITVEMFMKELEQKDYIEGGVMMLWLQDVPIGAVRVSRDCDDRGEFAFITYVSIVKEHRGKGLGKLLLRKAMKFAKAQGLSRMGLTVSADNSGATALYIGEGFSVLKSY
jgi:mycothiol synthase